VLCRTEPFAAAVPRWTPVPISLLEHIALVDLGDGQQTQLLRGCVLGVVELVECLKTQAEDEEPGVGEDSNQELVVWDPDEMAFGDFRPGRWAWELKVLQVFKQPVVARGALGLWTIEDALLPEWTPVLQS